MSEKTSGQRTDSISNSIYYPEIRSARPTITRKDSQYTDLSIPSDRENLHEPLIKSDDEANVY